jgi:hypothetical protein
MDTDSLDLGLALNGPHDGPILITPWQARFLSWTADVLIYVVVINLFVEYAPSVIIESFTVSLLTAVLLKLLLDSILGLEHRVRAWFARRSGAGWRITGLATTWAILFLSKFLIIEVTAIVFGNQVKLGGFIEVVALVIAMIAARRLMGLLYRRLAGVQPAPVA